MDYKYKRLVTFNHSFVSRDQLKKFLDPEYEISEFDLDIEAAVELIINNGWKLISVTEQGASYTYHFIKE